MNDRELALSDVKRIAACPFAHVEASTEIESHEFRAVIESALEPFVSLDDRGTIIAWNAQAEETFGWSRAEAIGQTATELIVPDHLQAIHRKKLAAYRMGVASDVVGKRVRLPSRHADGSPLTVELQVTATKTNDGATRFHAFIHDVTELERTRLALAQRERLLAESQRIARLGSYSHDLVTNAVVGSDELFRILGMDAASFDGTIAPLVARIHPDDRLEAIAAYRSAIAARSAYDFEHRIVRLDGVERIVRRRGVIDLDEAGRPIRVAATLQDVTAKRRADAARRDADARFTRSFEDSPFGLALVRAARPNFGTFVLVNDALARMLGYERDECVDLAYQAIVHPADLAEALAAGERLVHDGAARDSELRLRTKSGDVVWIRLHLSLMRDIAGEPLHFFLHVEDITSRRTERAAFIEMHERLCRSIEDAPFGMALMHVVGGAFGPFREVNGALCDLTGLDRDRLDGMRLYEIVSPDDADAVARICAEMLDGVAEKASLEVRATHADGDERWLSLHLSMVREGPIKRYAIVQIADITAAKRSEIHMAYLAHHDALTGVLNRRGFERGVEAYLNARETSSEALSILMIDIDYFKYVNDSFGHAAGDRILGIVAHTLQSLAGERECVARLGGDEFVMLMPGIANDAAIERARRVREAVACAVATQSGRSMHVTVSVGVATMDATAIFTIDDALAAADMALSTAKDEGRDRLSVAESVADANRTLRGRMEWAHRIRSALAERRFRLYRQPILDLQTRRTDRYEFLLRMLDEAGEVVMPSLFLEEAERFGLLVDIDTWVVTEAMRIVAESSRAGETACYEVNLSAASLADDNIVTHVRAELARTQIDPRLLTFELTETTAIRSMEKARKLIEALSTLGCEFALDDFGAGFSSFYYLKRLPFDFLKIDGEFIVNILDSEADRQIVRSIVSLARGLDKKTIAEFVGSAESLELLASYGVDFAQGYHVGKPEAIVSFAEPAATLG